MFDEPTFLTIETRRDGTEPCKCSAVAASEGHLALFGRRAWVCESRVAVVFVAPGPPGAFGRASVGEASLPVRLKAQ